MGRIVVTEFVSLDGVVEDPGGTGSFKHKGWSFDTDRRQEGVQSRLPFEVLAYLLDEALGTEAMLLGRTTYEELAALWPARDGELADRLNGLPKYVVSSTLERPAWNNSTVLRGDAVQEVSRLKRELDGNLVVPGSIRLARTLIEHDLVDGLRLMVYPVVLGGGERLFGELPDKKGLRLVDTTTVGDGIAVLKYETGPDAGLPSALS
jgi:dihydrofolate reductase